MHKIISSTIMNRLTSVSEYALNLNVQPETCLRRLLVCNNGNNGKNSAKMALFLRGPYAQWSWTQDAAGNCHYIPKFAVL